MNQAALEAGSVPPIPKGIAFLLRWYFLSWMIPSYRYIHYRTFLHSYYCTSIYVPIDLDRLFYSYLHSIAGVFVNSYR